MLPTEELCVYVYVLVHDLMLARAHTSPTAISAGNRSTVT
jgi:hypothetical protein